LIYTAEKFSVDHLGVTNFDYTSNSNSAPTEELTIPQTNQKICVICFWSAVGHCLNYVNTSCLRKLYNKEIPDDAGHTVGLLCNIALMWQWSNVRYCQIGLHNKIN